MDGRSAFSVLRSSAPFGLHATRTYTEGPRSERSTPHASTPIEPPFSATPGHITASSHQGKWARAGPMARHSPTEIERPAS